MINYERFLYIVLMCKYWWLFCVMTYFGLRFDDDMVSLIFNKVKL